MSKPIALFWKLKKNSIEKCFLSKKGNGYKKILGKKIVGQKESLIKKFRLKKNFGVIKN